MSSTLCASPGSLVCSKSQVQNDIRQSWKQGGEKGEHTILEPLVCKMKYLARGIKLSENPATQLLEPLSGAMVGINLPAGSDVVTWTAGNEFIQTGVGAKAQFRKAQRIQA